MAKMITTNYFFLNRQHYVNLINFLNERTQVNFATLIEFFESDHIPAQGIIDDSNLLWTHLLLVEKIFKPDQEKKSLFGSIHHVIKKCRVKDTPCFIEIKIGTKFRTEVFTAFFLILLVAWLFDQEVELEYKRQVELEYKRQVDMAYNYEPILMERLGGGHIENFSEVFCFSINAKGKKREHNNKKSYGLHLYTSYKKSKTGRCLVKLLSFKSLFQQFE